MKSFKYLIPILALGVFAASPLTQAQEKKGRGGMSVEARIEQLDKTLTLTADQKTKITAILEKGREEMQNVPKEERKGKMADMMKAQHDQIRAVLTPEQQKKFDDMPEPARGGGKKKDN